MPHNAEWVDLLDPDDDEPRPKFESHGGYVFGVLLRRRGWVGG